MAVEQKPRVAPPPLLKNSPQAPFVYFDSAPVHGVMNGNIEIELASRTLLPKADGSVLAEAVCTAHLRCTPMAAQQLIDALKHAIELHAKQSSDFLAQAHDLPRETLNS